MKFKDLFLAAALVVGGTSFAQEFETLDFNSETTTEEIDAHNDEASRCADWLIVQDYSPGTKDWDSAKNFMMKWVSVTDEFNITIHSWMIDYAEDNPMLLVIFFAGWTQYAFKHPENSDNIADCATHALAAVAVYGEKHEDALESSRELRRLIRRHEKDELGEWVQEQLED